MFKSTVHLLLINTDLLILFIIILYMLILLLANIIYYYIIINQLNIRIGGSTVQILSQRIIKYSPQKVSN